MSRSKNMVRILPFNPRIWKKKFPPKAGLDYSRLQLTDVGEYSITKNVFAEAICDLIGERFTGAKTPVRVTDATAGLGGMTIPLAMRFPHVTAVEVDPLHAGILKNNVEVYGLASRIHLIEDDFTDVFEGLVQDVVIIDPPWQGRGYKTHDNIHLYLSEIDVVDLIPKLPCQMVILFVPFNFHLEGLAAGGFHHKVHRIEGEKHYLVEITLTCPPSPG